MDGTTIAIIAAGILVVVGIVFYVRSRGSGGYGGGSGGSGRAGGGGGGGSTGGRTGRDKPRFE